MKLKHSIIIILIAWLPFLISAWNKNKPAGSDAIQDSDDYIRANNAALESAIGQDHEFSTGGTNSGKHTQVTFDDPISSPATVAASEGVVYLLDVADKAELHFEDEDENTVQITSGGKLLSSSLDMKDEDDMTSDSATHAASQQSIKAYVDSGTVTMTNKTLTSPVLNTDLSGTAFLDEDDMSSDSATKAASQQSIKKYVDDQDAADHPAYSGGESHTDGSGLIIKMGNVTVSANSTSSVSFGSAFPNDAVAVTVSLNTTDNINSITGDWAVSGLSKTGFTMKNGLDSQYNFYWIVVGY